MLNTVFIYIYIRLCGKQGGTVGHKTTFIAYMDIKTEKNTYKKIAKHTKVIAGFLIWCPVHTLTIIEPIWPMLQIYQNFGVILM